MSTCKILEPFEIIHSDMWVLASINFFNDCNILLHLSMIFHVLHDYIYLRSKVKYFQTFKEFSKMIFNQYNSKIKILRTYNGT